MGWTIFSLLVGEMPEGSQNELCPLLKQREIDLIRGIGWLVVIFVKAAKEPDGGDAFLYKR